MGTISKSSKVNSLCAACAGHCCKVGFIVQVDPREPIYDDSRYVHQTILPENGVEFRNMKSNGDGYTCIALGPNGECTVWSRRPQACKDFEVDGSRCKALRKYYDRP